MTRLIESIPMENLKDATHLDVEVFYSKGGVNFFTGRSAQRGYSVRVTPVTRRDGTVSFTIFTGLAKFLMPTQRFSQKQFETAVELGKESAPELIQLVLAKNDAA
jgi:hypothetical protein